MKRRLLITIAALGISVLLSPFSTQAQSTDLPKYEVAEDFSSLTLNAGTTLPGLGGRFTYNINRHLALEAGGYFFPGHCEGCIGETTGHVVEGLFGVKAGKRFQKWGLFAKARPGFMHFGNRAFDIVPLSTGPARGFISCFGPTNNPSCFRFQSNPLTAAVIDLGGVLEFYPSKRIVVRFDGGNTLIHYAQRTSNTLIFDPANPMGAPSLVPITSPGYTRNTLQFTAGVGFRF